MNTGSIFLMDVPSRKPLTTRPSSRVRRWVVPLACIALFVCGVGIADAQTSTTGLDQCKNKVGASTSTPSRYDPSTGRLDIPLVFVPGNGWYKAVLQQVSASSLEFSLTELTESCVQHGSPAAYFTRYFTVFVPGVELADGSATPSTYDVQLAYQSSTGTFVPSIIWSGETDLRAAVAPDEFIQKRSYGKFAALVPAVQLGSPLGTFPAGSVIALSRIGGGRTAGQDNGCSGMHLHGDAISIDGAGAYPDPAPHNCGYGLVITVDENLIGPGTINASVPSGTDYCGPDITSVFFARLKIMHQRLQALPDSERGMYDGTRFVASNGTNMDFVTGSLRDLQNNAVCPTANCSGTGHTSTFTLCGQCMISHIDNDIEFGFVSRSLGVPWSVQLAGAHAWDLLQRGSLDPLPSQLAYRIGNDLADALSATPTASDSALCEVVAASSLRTGFRTYRNTSDLIVGELSDFGKSSCVPCPYGCPEALVSKDFSTQAWHLNDGTTATYP
ncbi:MAG: hypothetical protein A3H32_04000 [Betaproteobacteria bacterium RIFCSPLOWO2_02_FULL_63_19]|nr:MAG: hypothetical protein A3H32_04000 [Betaproteobacteria bacterium RIFCSPLOWO2_02_FULL_63_19]